MNRRNPVDPLFRGMLAANDVVMLDALEAAWRVLQAATDALREQGGHTQADILDGLTDQLQETTEHIIEALTEEGGEDLLEGSELELSGEEREAATLEEDLVAIYADWLRYLETGDAQRFCLPDDQRALAAVLRDAAGPGLLESTTDMQLVEAARDVYKSAMAMRGHSHE
jgi:hypothetical protein